MAPKMKGYLTTLVEETVIKLHFYTSSPSFTKDKAFTLCYLTSHDQNIIVNIGHKICEAKILTTTWKNGNCVFPRHFKVFKTWFLISI